MLKDKKKIENILLLFLLYQGFMLVPGKENGLYQSNHRLSHQFIPLTKQLRKPQISA